MTSRHALQTQQQKAANSKFAKKNVNKQGKPQSVLKSKNQKSEIPVSRTWLIILLFLVIGGGVLELIRLFF
ncbi:hypothetical protein DFJ63DRAFT_334202 [Scheffersomyces coipomensis]|uniref:uncharacterized protein n=1 Tax=Scheffersomyces coipomensis TaxID=1788519 RepID=UPI00315CEA6D